MNPFKSRGEVLPASRDGRWKIGDLAAGLVTMGFGLLALLGWGLGQRWLASFGANLIPMAPSTAVLFLVFGAALGVRARTPLSLRALRGCGALAGAGTLVALLLFTLDWLHLHWDGEGLGLNSAETVGGAPIGHMSLVSACCFLLVGGSLLASLSRSAIRPWRTVLALVLAGVLLATSFIFLLAYGLGAPLLYNSTVIPPALTTVLAFGTLGLALLTLAARPAGLFSRLPGEKFQPTVTFVLVFLLLALSIVTVGYLYFRNSERHSRADAEEQLSVIADLKVAQIASWRRERLADANLLHATPYVARRALDALADSASPTTRQMFTGWLASLFAGGSYEQALLLDDQLRVGLTYPESPVGRLSDGHLRAAQEALRSRQVVVADLHRETAGGPVYLSLVVPLVVRQESTGEKVQAAGRGAAPVDRSAGVLVLRINAQKELYPLIQFWPTPSRTGETLLVRREGSEAVYLNELRFRKNSALVLRSSLASTHVPAVRAALGQEGIVEGRDYRGELVLAAMRGVPDSPWFLVARQDVAEVNAPLRAQLWQVIAMIGVLLFGAGAGMGLAWRQERLRFYRKRAELAQALQASQRVLAQAEELGRVGGWEFDVATRQQTWTKMVYDILELDRSTQPTVDEGINFYTPDSRPIIARAVQRAIEHGEPFDLELEIITAKGHRRSVHAVGAADRARGKVAGFFQDISERKQAEHKARQSHDLLANLARLMPGVVYQYRLFPDGRSAFPYASPGMNDIYEVSPAEVREDATPVFGRIHPDDYGRVGNLIQESARTLQTFQCEYRVILPQQGLRWRWSQAQPERMEDGGTLWHGIISDITERKQAEEALHQSRQAALNLMSDAVAARDLAERTSADLKREVTERQRAEAETLRLLAELTESRQVLLGVVEDLKAAEAERERLLVRAEASRRTLLSTIEDQRRAATELRASEARFRQAITDAPFPILLHAEDGAILQVSQSWCEITGYSREEMATIADWTERAYGEKKAQVRADIDTLFELGHRRYEGDYNVRTKAGAVRVWEFSSAPLGRVPDGRRLAISMAVDVTERREAESHVRRLNAELEQRVQHRTAELAAANKELEVFSYSVSHDLRAPLRSIDGFSRIVLEDYAAKLDEEGRDSLHRIRAAAQRMGQLIDDMLTLSRVSRSELGWEPVDLAAIAREVVVHLRQREPGRTVEVVVPAELKAAGDPRLLRIALENLLGNAWKFTGKCAAPRIEIGAGPTPPDAHLGASPVFFIRDNGAGFDPAYAAKLFGAFQRLHSNADFPGTGIGLATVQRVIHRHGGRIWAEAQVGQGATFFFTLEKSEGAETP